MFFIKIEFEFTADLRLELEKFGCQLWHSKILEFLWLHTTFVHCQSCDETRLFHMSHPTPEFFCVLIYAVATIRLSLSRQIR